MFLHDLYAPGPLVIFTVQFQHILTNYYLFTALILCNRKSAEQVFRASYLQAHVLSTVVEIVWAWLHPRALPLPACAWALVAYTLLHSLHVVLAFGSPLNIYSTLLALPLQVAAAVCLIPVGQLGYCYTVQSRVSPQRYRMLAWMLACGITVASFLSPSMASPSVAVLCATVLPLLATACLLRAIRHARDDAIMSMNNNVSTYKSDSRLVGKESVCVRLRPAAMFVALGCISGTLGESLTDSAITLAIRKSLREGKHDLALTNQLSIGVSMLLAYLSETRKGGARQMGCRFILAWMACQLARNVALDLLQGGDIGLPVMATLAFLDKYTGPLGTAALETALLALMNHETSPGNELQVGFAVPGAWLWSLRMAVSRLERPICQLLLLQTATLPVQWVALVFASTSCIGVLVILCHQESRAAVAKDA